MLPPLSGCVHLSVEGGCGGTTWALQYARNTLEMGKHVVWICNEIPDGERFSQIFTDVTPTAISKLHLSAVGENTEHGLVSATNLLRVLNNIELVVIDDWTSKTGKVKSSLQNSMNDLIELCTMNNVSMIAISSAYEDAAGAGWKSRGNLGGCHEWFLHRNNIESMLRELHTPDGIQYFTISDNGFTPHK